MTGIGFDISSLSTSMSMANVQSDVGVAMLNKQLDQSQVMGEGMVKAMELSVNPNVGSNFDLSV